MEQWIGLVAGALTTAAFVPQVMRAWRTGSTNDLSRGMLLLFFIVQEWWRGPRFEETAQDEERPGDGQAAWEQRGIFRASEDDPRPKYYVLEMFPYPSGRAPWLW